MIYFCPWFTVLYINNTVSILQEICQSSDTYCSLPLRIYLLCKEKKLSKRKLFLFSVFYSRSVWPLISDIILKKNYIEVMPNVNKVKNFTSVMCYVVVNWIKYLFQVFQICTINLVSNHKYVFWAKILFIFDF